MLHTALNIIKFPCFAGGVPSPVRQRSLQLDQQGEVHSAAPPEHSRVGMTEARSASLIGEGLQNLTASTLLAPYVWQEVDLDEISQKSLTNLVSYCSMQARSKMRLPDPFIRKFQSISMSKYKPVSFVVCKLVLSHLSITTLQESRLLAALVSISQNS